MEKNKKKYQKRLGNRKDNHKNIISSTMLNLFCSIIGGG
jgi:hypothetical protein